MPGRTWKQSRLPDCPVCGNPNPPRRLQCSAECKKIAKRAYDDARYQASRDETISRARAWQAENRGRKQAYDAEYRERTRVRRLAAKKEQARRVYDADPEQARARGRSRAAARRAHKAGNGAYVVLERDLRRALHRSRGRCAECGEQFAEDNPLEWDHVIPVARGGRHSIGNLTPLCRRCNRNKKVRLRVEWRAGRVVSLAA